MKQRDKRRQLNAEELAYFCTQLALVLKSGINLNDGLVMMLDEAKDDFSVSLLSKIAESVNSEKPLFVALEESKCFSKYFISMVKIGEMSGHLERVLEGLSVHYLREANLKSSVKSAVLHPVILLTLMAFVVSVLLIKVLPIFKNVFLQISSQFSNASSSAISFASQAGIVVLCLIGVILLLFLILYIISFSKKGKNFIFSMFSRLMIFKGITEKISISRFSSAMYLMLSSGFDISEALSLGVNVVSSPTVKEKIELCQEKVNNQESFAKAITDVAIFPPFYSQ